MQQHKPVIIRGIVIDSATKASLHLVTVLLTSNGNKMNQTTISSGEGKFKIAVADTGNYVLSFSSVGYNTHMIATTVAANATEVDLGNIELQKNSGVLSEVVVRSKKPLIQNKGDKIVYNASADIGNKAGSAADVLRKAPLLTVDANGEVKMRGSSNIKVLLNGLPSGILARNLKEALKMIPASSIESIEVISSPSAKYEAEGAAGVINIITRKKMKGTSGSIDVSGGNLQQSVNGRLNIASGKFNFNLALEAQNGKLRNVSELNRLLLNNGKVTGQLFQRSDATQTDKGVYGEFTAEYRADSSQKIGAAIGYWNGQWPVKTSLYNRNVVGTGITQYNQLSKQSGKFDYAEFTLDYQKKFKHKGQELVVISQGSNSNDQSDYITKQYALSGQKQLQEQSPNLGSSNSISLQADYTHPFNKSGKNLLEAGVRTARTNSVSSYTVYNNRNNPGGDQLTEDLQRADNLTYFQEVHAAYVSVKLETKHRWGFRTGLRYESTRLGADFKGSQGSFKTSFGNLVPSLLITKKLNDKQDLKFNYTQRIRRPWIWDLNPYVNASDPLNITYGNPQLRPEITRMLELGHSYAANSGFVLNSSVYFNSNTNAIESLTTVDSGGVSRATPKNIAAYQRVGTNLNVSIAASEKWTINLGTELYRVVFTSRALNVQNKGNFLAINLNTSYSLPRDYMLQLSADYSNGYITLQGRNTASYNYSFSVRKEFWNKKAGLTLNVTNPFQNNFFQQYAATAPSFQSTTGNLFYHRSVTLSFSWKFGGLRSGTDAENRPGNQKEGQPMRRR